jgi:hypothetical protein
MTAMRSTLRVLLRAGVLGTAVAMSGCASSSSGTSNASTASNGGTSSASAAVPDACVLLTRRIAKQILGRTAKQTIDAKPNQHITHCQYISDSGTIDVLVTDDWGILNTGQQHVPGEKPFPGVGDEAHINAVGLRVRKGNRGIQIMASATTAEYAGAAIAPTTLAQTIEIKTAKALLPRL